MPTSPRCQSGVSFVPIMFRAFLMERYATHKVMVLQPDQMESWR
jgi:hypothetical protein